MIVALVGGPLDGKQKAVTRDPPSFVFVAGSNLIGQAAITPIRFFRAPGKDRCLYRLDSSRKDLRKYIFAGYTHAVCCGALHQIGEGGLTECLACGEPLHAAC